VRSVQRGAMLALLAIIGAVLGGTLAAPAAAAAKQSLVITGLATEDGVVRFTLTARDLPPATPLDTAAVRVRVGDTVLRTETSATAPAESLPPRALVLVIDGGAGATTAYLDALSTAAGGLAATLPADVQLGLVTVTSKATLVLGPTHNRDQFVAAVQEVRTAGSAELAEGVSTALEALQAAGFRGASDRRVLMFSAGNGERSGVSDPAVRTRMADEGVPVDVIAIGADTDGLARLKSFVDVTGGRLTATDETPAAESGMAAGRAFSVAVGVTAFVPSRLAGVTSRIEVEVDSLDLSASAPVTFASAPTSPGTPLQASLGWVPSWVAYLVGAILFVAIAAMVLTVAWPRSQKHARIMQIAHFGPGRKMPSAKPEPASAGSVIARTALAATASVVRSGGLGARIALRLERAGMRMRWPEGVLLRTCITVATAALLFAVASWPGALMGLVLGWLLTVLYQSIRVDRRANLFSEQLPDALQLVIGSLKSGFSLPQSLESLARESPDPVAAEFGRALAEHRLGADVSDALERVAQRTQSEDLGWAVMAVRIQREVGGNLAEVLQTTVDTMRERGRLRRHVRSLSAEGRLSAWVLIGLPIGLGSFMFFYRRDYMAPLFTDPLGVTLLVAGGLLFVVGIVWMTRVIKVEA